MNVALKSRDVETPERLNEASYYLANVTHLMVNRSHTLRTHHGTKPPYRWCRL